jgi:hypothetical protein
MVAHRHGVLLHQVEDHDAVVVADHALAEHLEGHVLAQADDGLAPVAAQGLRLRGLP